MAIDFLPQDSFISSPVKRLFGYFRPYVSSSPNSDRRTLIDSGVLPPRLFNESTKNMSQAQPELEKLISEVKSGDAIIVPSLAHIASNLEDVLSFLEQISKQYISVVILSIGNYQVDIRGNLSPTARTIYQTLVETIAFQKQNESSHQEAKITKTIGRPKSQITDSQYHAYALLRGLQSEAPHSYTITAKLTGYSVSTIQRIVRKIEKNKKS